MLVLKIHYIDVHPLAAANFMSCHFVIITHNYCVAILKRTIV
jgi:hypothetical protein